MRNLDRKLWRSNTIICGVDEVGRGALAGPVVAAAVVLPLNIRIPGVRDSKLLSPKERCRLAAVIKSRALAWAVAAVGHHFIDRVNIVNATFYVMRQAVLRLQKKIGFSIDSDFIVLVDGAKIPGLEFPCEGIIRGDQQSLSIACASIVAKVYRDELMMKMDKLFPGYELARHKGYGTPQHLAALKLLGPSPIHRRSFEPVKSLLYLHGSRLSAVGRRPVQGQIYG